MDWKRRLITMLKTSSKYRQGDIFRCDCSWCGGQWHIVFVTDSKWAWYSYEDSIYELEDSRNDFNEIRVLEDQKHKLVLVYRN